MNYKIKYLFIIALVLYWPCIFTFAHLPQVPTWILRTQLSDKTMHFLGYLILVFLWWFSIWPKNNPKRRWQATLVTVIVMAVYAGLDEWLQSFVHRTPDVHDFVADMSGIFLGLLFFLIFDFIMCFLAITAVAVIIIANFTRLDVFYFLPIGALIFYFVAYFFIAVLWANELQRRVLLSGMILSLAELALPAALLISTLIVGWLQGKYFKEGRFFAAVIGMVLPVVIKGFLVRRKAG